MSNCMPGMTPAAIKYLLVLDDLCREGKGVRSVEIAARMNVSKPSAHSMLQNLCLEEDACQTAAYAILAQSQDRLPQLRDRLRAAE